MSNAQIVFRANMRETETLTDVYEYLTHTVTVPLSLDDLLRSKIVYAVSAFDKLIHDLVRIGMVDIFTGKRAPTPKYLAEPITLNVLRQLTNATSPPPDVIFEQAVLTKLKTLSFQDPDKVAEGLSYIWDENHKWQHIAATARLDEKSTRTTLKLIASRRNSIVHEADMDPVTHTKYPISKSEADDTASFLLNVGNAICTLVG